MTIVVSPLLALIEDQVSQLITNKHCGGIPAAYLTSSTPEAAQGQIYEDLLQAAHGYEPILKLLYVTPEGVQNSSLLKKALKCLDQKGMLARFVIDEA